MVFKTMNRKLKMEKTKLEESIEVESRASARMSLEFEQLQWRIMNNLEIPPVQLKYPLHQFSRDDSSCHQR